MKILVTNKTDFKVYDDLELGEVLHFNGRGTYIHPNGEEGAYNQWWLDAMLKSGAFVEVTEDDQLPPVPDSVLYREEDSPVGTDAELLVKGSRYGGLLLELRAHRKSDDKFAWAGMRLDPDAALQLAHDLRRMAMQIKRNQKQGGESK